MVAQRCCWWPSARRMEDNIYLEKGKLAPSNAALVEKAGKIIQILGDEIDAGRRAGDAVGCGANQ